MEAELIRFKAKSIDERALLFPPGSWVLVISIVVLIIGTIFLIHWQ